MERLRQRDLDGILSFLREMYSRPDLEGFANRLVSALPGLVPSEWTSYNEVDLQRQANTYVIDPIPPDASELALAFERHILDHPLISHQQELRDGQALKTSDFLTQTEFHRLGLYGEFFRKLDVEYQMAVVLPSSSPLVIGVAVNRGRRDFSERERLTLDLVRPHLLQARESAGTMTRLARDVNLARLALEESGRGIVSLTEKGRVRWSTEQARSLLSEYFEPPSAADRLPDSLSRWVERQRLPFSSDNIPPPHGPLILARREKRLTARLAPGGYSDTDDLLILEERSMVLSTETLESLGLTRREVEVLALAARGRTNEQLASELFISPGTARKHLEHINQKLGAASRTEAIARALEASGLLTV